MVCETYTTTEHVEDAKDFEILSENKPNFNGGAGVTLSLCADAHVSGECFENLIPIDTSPRSEFQYGFE